MDFFQTKTILAVVAVTAAVTAALSMLTLMGRSERRASVTALRNAHRAAGYTFAVLLVALAIMGIRYLALAGDTLSVRGVLHWVLASLLVGLFVLKIAVVRWFKQFIKYVPVMGMMLIVLIVLVATVSAGFYIVAGGSIRGREQTPRVESAGPHGEAAGDESPIDGLEADVAGDNTSEIVRGDASSGETLFGSYCSSCHDAASAEARMGPGLAGLFAREKIKASGKPITRDNVRVQIISPSGGMPSFEGHLSESELDDLVAYLATL